MLQPARYLITAALPYANGPLHVGHLAGAYLSADVFSRYLKGWGHEVCFVCGSDEHGAAITMRAMKEGTTPQSIIDKYHAQFEHAFKGMRIDFDVYHRTSAALHHETSQAFFKTLYDKGVFAEKTIEQYFDEEKQQFLADRYIKGTCPKCGYVEAYGDQCEHCGSSLSPQDLIDPVSTLSGAKPVMKTTTHWYLPLDEYEAWLRAWIEDGRDGAVDQHDAQAWKNHVIGQCKSWLDGGLTPRAMTRDLDWGVDVPSEIEGSEGKKLYVWMDAPIGYISATKQWAINRGEPEAWRPYWQGEDTALYHFIGKDNIVFHCLIFPALLHAHGDYTLAQQVPANQFMNLEGQKISTSRDWAVWVHDVVDEMPELVDAMRYYLIKTMPEQRDSEFTWQSFKEANDNELVNTLANFIHRVVVLVNKYYDGKLPEVDLDQMIIGPDYADEPSFMDAELLRLFDMGHEVHAAVMKCEFRQAQQSMMAIAAMGNQFLQFNEPWKSIKKEPEQAAAVLYHGVQIVYVLSRFMQVFMPGKAEELAEMLGIGSPGQAGELVDMMNVLAEGDYPLPMGHQLGKAKHLFARLADGFVEARRAKLASSRVVSSSDDDRSVSEADQSGKPSIEYSDFAKIDLRTGVVRSAEHVPKTDKLMKIIVDLGSEERTVVSGIAQHYQPDEIVGQQVTLVANLAPRKMRGVESQGMILMAEDGDGRLRFVSSPTDTSPGSVVS